MNLLTNDHAKRCPEGKPRELALSCGRSSMAAAIGSYPKGCRFKSDRPHPMHRYTSTAGLVCVVEGPRRVRGSNVSLCGCNSAAECLLYKKKVGGSNPSARTVIASMLCAGGKLRRPGHAGVAQSAEHCPHKAKVARSTRAVGTRLRQRSAVNLLPRRRQADKAFLS